MAINIFLMLSKKELKKIKDDIQKSNKEYDNIVSKIKLARTDLLKINNEFKEKSEYAKKIKNNSHLYSNIRRFKSSCLPVKEVTNFVKFYSII